MKKLYTLFIISYLTLNIGTLIAQTIWTGPIMTFTRENFVDWELEENQDRMTDIVWITRADFKGIYNIYSENFYADYFSPEDTEWSYGTTADIGSLTLSNWQDTVGSFPPSMVGQDMVIHLITDDIYIDLKFTYWATGGEGGGFSYERSTDQNLGTMEFELSKKWKVVPNPSNDFIKVPDLFNKSKYGIYDYLGKEICKGDISYNETIDIHYFENGLYFIKIYTENQIIIKKFIKNN